MARHHRRRSTRRKNMLSKITKPVTRTIRGTTGLVRRTTTSVGRIVVNSIGQIGKTGSKMVKKVGKTLKGSMKKVSFRRITRRR